MDKPKKNKPYMMYMKQSLFAVKPQYQVYRDGMNAVYTIEGDVTRHRFWYNISIVLTADSVVTGYAYFCIIRR